MDPIDQLIAFVTESNKILHMDSSHSALHTSIQRHLAIKHRMENPDGDYYGYPTVQDVFGDQETGKVVYSKAGTFTRSDYKVKDGVASLSNHTPVKKAYVAESDLTQESEIEHTVEIQESALDKNGKGEICLIKPCTGSMAHYTAESLQRTAAAKVFSKDTKMFIDHQTAEERAARPEGSVLKQAAVLEADATWKEGKDGYGLYAPIKVYKDFAPFINERAKDIGVSVRGHIRPTGKIVNGVPEVLEFAKATSVDFVTKAGAGGKLISVYESYREQRGKVEPEVTPNPKKEGIIDMEVKESDFKALQDQAALVPRLITRLDRVEESNRRFVVRDIVDRLVKESKLPERAQARIAKPFLSATYVPPVKDDALDITVLEASIKEAIKDETAYLQESGVLRMSPVQTNGADGKLAKEPTEEELMEEADRTLAAASRTLSGLPALEEAKK